MDLRQLSYFVAVADEGGIRAAARQLHIAQPSISQALRALEQELGAELVRRSARGVELTAAGEELVGYAREILSGVGAARVAVRRVVAQQSKTLRVGLVSGVVSAGELLAPILETFREMRPDVTLQLDEISFCDQVTPLLRHAVDVVIVRGPIDTGPLAHSDVRVTAVAEEPRVLLVGAGHELAAAERVRLDDVLRFPTLPLGAPDRWSAFWQLADVRGGSTTDDTVSPAGTVPEVQLAVATRGVIVTTPGTVARLQPHPLVRTVGLDGAQRAVIGIACRRRDMTHVVRQFIEAAQVAAERHIGLLPGGALPR